MFIYLGRHLQPKLDGRRKKDPDDNLTGPAHKLAFAIASKFKKANIEWVIASEFRRSEMCGTATVDELRLGREKLIVTPLANELEIPSIWGESYSSSIMRHYLDWRTKIFSNPTVTNFSSPFPFDPEAESFLEFCQRQDKFLNWLTSFSGNKIVWGHSQAIEAILYHLSTGQPKEIDPVNFINQYQTFFPHKYGQFATLHYDGTWSILAHGQSVPYFPK